MNAFLAGLGAAIGATPQIIKTAEDGGLIKPDSKTAGWANLTALLVMVVAAGVAAHQQAAAQPKQ